MGGRFNLRIGSEIYETSSTVGAFNLIESVQIGSFPQVEVKFNTSLKPLSDIGFPSDIEQGALYFSTQTMH